MIPWALVLADIIAAGFDGVEKKNLLRTLMLAVVARWCYGGVAMICVFEEVVGVIQERGYNNFFDRNGASEGQSLDQTDVISQWWRFCIHDGVCQISKFSKSQRIIRE